MSSGEELPAELTAKPLALIGVNGLDTVNNAVHKCVWDAFGNNRRADRAQVHFKLLPNDHRFPVIKPRRNSYEWFIPKGILKRNWMNKHLNLVPAVIVIFYDMDWTDAQWNEKIIECASRVQSMRAVTSMHAPKIAVVVIQNSAPLPSSEDVVGNERAQALCAACEIQPKSLFVLPYGDHFMGYALRLENAFYDLAQEYYHHEIRNIKLHREYLNKTTHQYLFVRHQFKIGFISELKQDFNNAQKHYLNAYNNLSEVRTVEANLSEIKTIAGYINYKLCNILFNRNQPRDAIAQLRNHIERYSNKIGIKELAFEHHAWMTKQYSTFGDLFNEAIRRGLPAIQIQHPGFYYQQAAECATKRREACRLLCGEATVYPAPDPLQGASEFYGQHAWRAGKLSSDLSDPQKERDAVRALQYNELHGVNHSMIIISLLGNSITQFKTYRCPRMRRHLFVQMAQEYYTCADYGKALICFTRTLCDYRKEKWWYIVSVILNKALACAYLTASIQEYIMLSIEALGKNIAMQGDKLRIFNNLMAVVNNEFPQPEPNVPESCNQIAIQNWQSLVGSEYQNIEIDMTSLASFIEVKARFTENKYEVDKAVSIELFLRISAPAPVQLKQINVCVNNLNLVVCNNESSILFEDDGVKKFVCQFIPEPQDVGKTLQITAIELYIGKSDSRRVNLKFGGLGSLVMELYPEIFNYRMFSKEIPDFSSIQPVVSTQIIPRKSKMSIVIEQEDPALIGEWFPITINLINDEVTDAHHIQLSLMFIDQNSSESTAELCFEIEDNNKPLPLLLSVGTLKCGATFKKTFYLRSNRVLSTNVLMKITYDINMANDKEVDKKKMACFKEYSIKVTVVKPFEISTKYTSMQFKEIKQCFVESPFIFMPYIKVLSPWPLLIENSTLEIAEHFQMLDLEQISCLKGLTIEENVIANEALCLKATTALDNQSVTLGTYSIVWRRKSSPSPNTFKTSSLVVSPVIAQSWLRIETVFPAHGCLRSPLPFKLILHSMALYPFSLNLRVEASDSFMFSGYRQCTVTILPDSKKEFLFNFYPLICGSVSPPRFHLSPVETTTTSVSVSDQLYPNITQEYLQELLDRAVPSHIFIMPQEKVDTLMEKSTASMKIGI